MYTMKILSNWHKARKSIMLSLVFGCSVVLYSTIFIKEAAAQTFVVKSPLASISTSTLIANLPPEGKFKEPENYAERSVQLLVQETQASFDKAVVDTNEVLNKLPEEVVKTNIEGEIVNEEKSLEKVGDSVDEIVEKVSNFKDKFVGTGVLEDKDLISKLEKLQASLEDSAEKIDILAADTAKAEEGASNSLQNRIDKEVVTLKKSFDDSDAAFKAFTLNPA